MTTLRVTLPYKPVDDAAVDAQVNRLRDQHATLTESSRPLALDDFATIDISGTQDGEEVEGLVASDFLYPVGSNMIVDELDEQLRGTKPGEILEFDSVLPDRFGERAGETVHFRVMVKGAQEKVLPDLTDEWVDEATEFDTVAELRADVRRRSEILGHAQAQMAFRDRVLEEAAELVTVMPPETLVETEVRNRINDLAERLAQQRVSLEQYLGATGQDPDAFLEGVREGARKGVLADLALRAVAAHEELEASDDDLEAELARLAERMGQKVEKVRATSTEGVSWRRYARTSQGARRCSSWSITPRWSMRRATPSISHSTPTHSGLRSAPAITAISKTAKTPKTPKTADQNPPPTRQKEHRADVHALRHREHQPGLA